MENKVKELKFIEKGDERGHLVVAEALKDIPFIIKRIFYIYGSDERITRGKHANKKSDFVLINLCGKCKVKTIDETGKEEIYNLDKPHIGLFIPKMIWKDMYDFSSDSILLCLSNEYYDANEYIRNLDGFLANGKNDK